MVKWTIFNVLLTSSVTIVAAFGHLSAIGTKKYPLNQSVIIEYESSQSQTNSHTGSILGSISVTSPTSLPGNTMTLTSTRSRSPVSIIIDDQPTTNSSSKSTDSCVFCIQEYPKCRCNERSSCRLVSQDCNQCAHYECAPTATVAKTVRMCVNCPPFNPVCNCKPGYICMYRQRTCQECGRMECIKPLL